MCYYCTMGFFGRLKNFCIPTTENAYRPGVLGRQALLFFLGVILAAEGFLVTNLVGRSSFGEYLAAVIGSEIILLTNAERVQAAAPDLIENEILDAAAQRKAEDMAARSYFSHVGPDGKQPWAWISEEGYDYTVAGENLAVRFVDSSDVVEAWMDSPTHKANIVKPVYEEIGVGIAQGSYKGSSATFVVQFFGTPRKVVVVSSPTPVPPQEQPSVTTTASATVSEVAGESVAAAPTPAAPVFSAPHPPSLSESLLRTFARVVTEPRATTAWILGGVAVLLVLALALAFLVHIQVQPVDLLLRGSLVAVFALFLIAVNGQMLSSSANYDQAAALGANGSDGGYVTGGVIIGDSGATTERFTVEY